MEYPNATVGGMYWCKKCERHHDSGDFKPCPADRPASEGKCENCDPTCRFEGREDAHFRYSRGFGQGSEIGKCSDDEECECMEYRSPTTEPAESEGKGHDGHYVCAEKVRTAPFGDLLCCEHEPHAGCDYPPTAPPEAKALEGFEQFCHENGKALRLPDEIPGTVMVAAEKFAEQYAAKLLAERDKQTVEAFSKKARAYLDEQYHWGLYPPSVFDEALRSVADGYGREGEE
jgi:hypothetical protein